MPFPTSIRKWILRVAGGGKESEAHCQVEIYTEGGGYKECGSKVSLQVHHLDPEAEMIAQGKDPDGVLGLIVCAWHHVMGRSDVIGEPDASFHPDMANARDEYRKGDKDAFRKAARVHQEKARRGERFVAGDWSTDEHYKNKVMEQGVKYTLNHPEDPRPKVKHRKEKPKKVWSNSLMRYVDAGSEIE